MSAAKADAAGVVEEFLLHLAEERIISDAQLQLAQQALGVWRPVMEQQQLEGQAEEKQEPAGLESGKRGRTHHPGNTDEEEEPRDQSPPEPASKRCRLNPSQLNRMMSTERPQEAEAEGRLSLLPDSVLDQLLLLLAAEPGGSSVRRTCRWLRSAFDRCNSRMAIKRSVLPGFVFKFRKLVRNSPGINSLTLEEDVTVYTGTAGGELLPRLERLCLKGPRWNADIGDLSQCSSLRHLELQHCAHLCNMAPLASCVKLQHVDLRGCSQVKDIQPLASCIKLQHLDLRGCSQVDNLQPLSACVELQHMDLGGCSRVQDLGPLAPCVKMQYLDLAHCEPIDLGPLSAMVGLQHLNLGGSKVTDWAALSSLVQLRCLWLSCCPMEDLNPLSTCIRLEHLCIHACDRLQDLGPLAACTALSSLMLSYCSVQQLEPLAACVRLRYLDLEWCRQVHDLAPLAALVDLQCLNLRGCSTFLDLGPLAALSGLTILKP